MQRGSRGYALGFVLTVLAVLAMGSTVVMYVLTAGIAETRRSLGEQRVFYSCDSAIRLASRITESVVLANPRLPADQVTQMAMDEICDAAGGCLGTRTGITNGAPSPYSAAYYASAPGEAVGPDGFMPEHSDMEVFTLQVRPLQNVNTIQAGAFADLFAIQSDVQIEVQGIYKGTGTVSSARDQFSLATISPFQLMAFATAPISWTPFGDRVPFVPPGVSLARVGPSIYADGVLNLNAGSNQLRLTRAVSTGVMTASAAIWDGDLGAPAFNAFVGPNGVRANQIRVPLTLPVQPARKPAQPAAEAPRSTRWLLDPPAVGPGGDNAAAREAKLAGQADVRIIDGIWFVKPTAGPDWPGIPVWSDHAGTNVQPARAETRKLTSPDGSGAAGSVPLVGQRDLKALHAWTRVPTGYSYYEMDTDLLAAATATVTTDPLNSGVISYGNLVIRTGQLVPGAWDGNNGPNSPCDDTPASGLVGIIPFNRCTPANMTGGLMDAARYGFRDISAQQDGGGNSATKVLPMNFDVAAFLAALQDGREGELGSYFCGAVTNVNDPGDVPAAGCRSFNGIVWVGATWPGSMDGVLGAGTPAMQPPQGLQITTGMLTGALAPLLPLVQPMTMPVPSPPALAPRYLLPEQLCTDSTLEGNAFDPTASNKHRAVGCGTVAWNTFYGTGSVAPAVTAPRAGATAVRIINGKNLSAIISAQVPGRLGTTAGFTVASNIPVYVAGDYNTVRGAAFTTGVVCPAVPPTPPACILPRTLIAGDRITFQSNAGGGTGANPGWSDQWAPWSSPLGGGPIQARRTTFVAAFMTGLVRPGGAENIESTFRVQERWDPGSGVAQPFVVLGAMFATGRSYYRPDPQAVSGYVPNPRLRWDYNATYSTLNQPPGTPRFLVGVANKWRDLRASPAL